MCSVKGVLQFYFFPFYPTVLNPYRAESELVRTLQNVFSMRDPYQSVLFGVG